MLRVPWTARRPRRTICFEEIVRRARRPHVQGRPSRGIPKHPHDSVLQPVAGNGLIARRALLGRGVVFAGAVTAGGAGSTVGAAAEPLVDGPWSNEVGAVIPPYQVASRFEKHVVRTVDNPDNVPRNSRARTPHHLLQDLIHSRGLPCP